MGTVGWTLNQSRMKTSCFLLIFLFIQGMLALPKPTSEPPSQQMLKSLFQDFKPLLETGAETYLASVENSSDAIQVAIEEGHDEIVEWLLFLRPRMEYIDDYCLTAVIFAALHNMKIVELPVNQKANVLAALRQCSLPLKR